MNAGNCDSCSNQLKTGGAKKKLSVYNKFVKKKFTVLKKQFPSLTAPEIMKKIGEEWQKTK
jgi:hypothetical protein